MSRAGRCITNSVMKSMGGIGFPLAYGPSSQYPSNRHLLVCWEDCYGLGHALLSEPGLCVLRAPVCPEPLSEKRDQLRSTPSPLSRLWHDRHAALRDRL